MFCVLPAPQAELRTITGSGVHLHATVAGYTKTMALLHLEKSSISKRYLGSQAFQFYHDTTEFIYCILLTTPFHIYPLYWIYNVKIVDFHFYWTQHPPVQELSHVRSALKIILHDWKFSATAPTYYIWSSVQCHNMLMHSLSFFTKVKRLAFSCF